MILILCLILAVASACLYCLVSILTELKDLRSEAKAILRTPVPTRDPVPFPIPVTRRTITPHHSFLVVGYQVIWEWREEKWYIKSSNHPIGFHPGLPPAKPGQYAGELVKTRVP